MCPPLQISPTVISAKRRDGPQFNEAKQENDNAKSMQAEAEYRGLKQSAIVSETLMPRDKEEEEGGRGCFPEHTTLQWDAAHPFSAHSGAHRKISDSLHAYHYALSNVNDPLVELV